MADIEFKLNKDYPELEIEYKAEMGDTVNEIIEASKKYSADMIVMGTHGSTGILRNLMGSNTSHVIKQAICPVLAIPDGTKFKGFNTITLALDFSEIYNNKPLEQFTEFATIFDSRINLLQVITKPDQKNLIEKEIERIKLMGVFQNISFSTHIVLNENVTQAIEYFVDETKTDVLAIMPHKHTFWEFLFNKSISQDIVFSIHKPMLCLPAYSN